MILSNPKTFSIARVPAKSALFFNLELADTYKSDHETLALSKPVQIILN